MPTIPQFARLAIADPKCASDAALEASMAYVDAADPEAFELAREELSRRGDYGYEPPQY